MCCVRVTKILCAVSTSGCLFVNVYVRYNGNELLCICACHLFKRNTRFNQAENCRNQICENSNTNILIFRELINNHSIKHLNCDLVQKEAIGMELLADNTGLSLQTLNDDCVFEILVRLPTNYLYTIGETCTRLFNLAAIQYRHIHPEKFACVTMIKDKIVLLPDQHDVQMFGRKFLNMVIRGYGRNYKWDDDLLEFILINCSSNWRIVRFEEAMLQDTKITTIKNMLHRVDSMVLHKCGMLDDFYNGLLSKCHRLNQLILSDSHPMISSDDCKWLQMKYPLLQSVRICSITMYGFQKEQWIQFFQQNPQIKCFSCDHWYSIDPTDRPVNVFVKHAPNLTQLYLSLRGIGHLNATYYDLDVLCERKQFQSLELQFSSYTGLQYLLRHSKILAGLKKLHGLHLTNNSHNINSNSNNNIMSLDKETATVISTLQSLKRLNFVNVTFTAEFADTLSSSLPNLEGIYCDVTNDFTAFIRNAPKLSRIELFNTYFGAYNLGWGLHWLNEERIKIPYACPITIYVKNTAIEDAEQCIISNGIITIEPLVEDKRILTKVKNTFVHF